MDGRNQAGNRKHQPKNKSNMINVINWTFLFLLPTQPPAHLICPNGARGRVAMALDLRSKGLELESQSSLYVEESGKHLHSFHAFSDHTEGMSTGWNEN